MSFRCNREHRTPNDPDAHVYENSFFDFMIESCQEDLKEILKSTEKDNHFGLLINFVELSVSCSRVGNVLLRNPDIILHEGDKAARRALNHIYDNNRENRDFTRKEYVHVRIHSLPSSACWDRYMTIFPGTKEIGNFFTIVGTVVRTKIPMSLEFCKEYICHKCKELTLVEAPASRYHAFPKKGEKCPDCAEGILEPTEADNTNIINKRYRMKDYQEIKLQEQSKFTQEIPKSLWVSLENDLVDSCKPGDDVTVTGKLFLRFKPLRINEKIASDFIFLANHLQVNNNQRASIVLTDKTIATFKDFWKKYENNPFEGRMIILKSFAPEVYGMYQVKSSIVLVLVGGVAQEKSSTTTRGESHLLLVGDPGTGKSQLLKYLSKLCPRTVMTTGGGTTTAGLTVSAIKDGGDWILEAGSLVLADGGVCCIDEFSNMKETDRVSLHEAMEQQTISVAKAGIICKLSTKCTIIAACNPKTTKYDTSQNMEVNIGLKGPLLSRFDLIIILKDTENQSWDEHLCDFVLGNAMKPINTIPKQQTRSELLWDSYKLQSYLVLIKEKKPIWTSDAECVIRKYYSLQRDSETRKKNRTTIRMYESIVRLAEGHAKLMYREHVLLHDAITAVSLIEASDESSSLSSMTNPLHTLFPDDPLQEYYNQANSLLKTLGLPELWLAEKMYLENLKARIQTSTQPSRSNINNPTSQQELDPNAPETGSIRFQPNPTFRDLHIPTNYADEEEVDEFFNDNDAS